MNEEHDHEDSTSSSSRKHFYYAVVTAFVFYVLFRISMDMHKAYLASLSAFAIYFGACKYWSYIKTFPVFKIVLAALILVHLSLVVAIPFEGISGPAILLGPIAVADAVIIIVIFSWLVDRTERQSLPSVSKEPRELPYDANE